MNGNPTRVSLYFLTLSRQLIKRLSIYFQCGVHGGCLVKLADKGGERRDDMIGCQYLSRLLR
jgi:hypothetical protein